MLGALRAFGGFPTFCIDESFQISSGGVVIPHDPLVHGGHGDMDCYAGRPIGGNGYGVARGAVGAEAHSSREYVRTIRHMPLFISLQVDFFLPQGLCEEICGQVIGLFCVRQVMNGERKAPGPRLLGIVAQLYLYLTIGVGAGGIFIHEDVGIGRNCFPNIGKAGALL